LPANKIVWARITSGSVGDSTVPGPGSLVPRPPHPAFVACSTKSASGGVGAKPGLWTGPWTGLWTGLWTAYERRMRIRDRELE